MEILFARTRAKGCIHVWQWPNHEARKRAWKYSFISICRKVTKKVKEGLYTKWATTFDVQCTAELHKHTNLRVTKTSDQDLSHSSLLSQRKGCTHTSLEGSRWINHIRCDHTLLLLPFSFNGNEPPEMDFPTWNQTPIISSQSPQFFTKLNKNVKFSEKFGCVATFVLWWLDYTNTICYLEV